MTECVSSYRFGYSIAEEEPITKKFEYKIDSKNYTACDSIIDKTNYDINITTEVFKIRNFNRVTVKISSIYISINKIATIKVNSINQPRIEEIKNADFIDNNRKIDEPNGMDGQSLWPNEVIDNSFKVILFIIDYLPNSFKISKWEIEMTGYTSYFTQFGTLNILVKYIEDPVIEIYTNIINNKNLLKNSSLLVPQINIIGSTLVDGSDVGQIIFKIKDKYSYTQNTAKANNGICKMEEITTDQLIITNFEKDCILIKNLVIGNGESLRKKIGNIWNDSTDNFDEFFGDFLEYSMARYILSKILYGDFNKKYLLRKYYNKFLLDLGKSRFCNFVNFFKDPKYSQMYTYFK